MKIWNLHNCGWMPMVGARFFIYVSSSNSVFLVGWVLMISLLWFFLRKSTYRFPHMWNRYENFEMKKNTTKDYVSLNHHKYDECMIIHRTAFKTNTSFKQRTCYSLCTTILICFDCSIHLVAHKDNIFCSIGPKNVWCMHNQIF